MPIPDFQTIMLPLLQYSSDGAEHRMADALEHLAAHFGLTQEELVQLLPSGRRRAFYNRLEWAKTYLSRARLIETTRRGYFVITARGRELLATDPDRISLALLSKYPEIQEFRAGKPADSAITDVATEEEHVTPEERIATSHAELTASITQELLDRIGQQSPAFFEDLVIDVLVKMGYGGSRAEASRIGRSGDGGIDGIIKEDRLGLDVIYVQAKRWQGTVGRPDVQAFAGSLVGQHANKGVMITTSKFSPDALAYASTIGMKVVLIDGAALARYMLEYGVGVATDATYLVQRVALEELDYYDE